MQTKPFSVELVLKAEEHTVLHITAYILPFPTVIYLVITYLSLAHYGIYCSVVQTELFEKGKKKSKL